MLKVLRKLDLMYQAKGRGLKPCILTCYRHLIVHSGRVSS